MIKKPSNKSFGIVFSIVFFSIGIFLFIDTQSIKILPFLVSFIFLFLGLVNSKFLTPLNIAWLKFGEILGRFVAPIVMGLIYFFIITPIGLFMRIIGKDLLQIKFSEATTYWNIRKSNIGPMKRQF